MAYYIRFDEVTIFGGKLSFLIPQQWIEQDSEDKSTVLYQEEDPEGGWFRVSLLTADNVSDLEERLRQASVPSRKQTMDLQTRNLVEHWEKDTEQDGTPLHIYYWTTTNSPTSGALRTALFSYTVLAKWVDRDRTREMVAVMNQVLPKAKIR